MVSLTKDKDKKRKGYVLVGFAILYFIFTVFFGNHGIHFWNTSFTVALLVWGFLVLLEKN